MHTIPAYTPSVTLSMSDGSSRTFKSLRAALDELGMRWIAKNLGEHFYLFNGFAVSWAKSGCVRTPTYRMANAIMRNDLGDVITLTDFQALIARRPRHSLRSSYWVNPFWDGQGPVPGTSKRRRGHYFREISTTPARRLAQRVDRAEPAPRAKRNAANLPSSWDDLGIAAREDRSWKRHRRTQWKSRD